MLRNFKKALTMAHDALSQRKPSTSRSKPARGGRLRFESLEPRLVLDGVPATAADLMITEINYNPYHPTPAEVDAGYTATLPEDAEKFFEFIELQNISSQTIDLVGVEFVPQSGTDVAFEFTAASRVNDLAPNQFVVIVANEGAFQFRYGSLDRVAGQWSGSLGNDGDDIVLQDRNGSDILNFQYEKGGGWPGRADGDGATLELIDPAAVPLNQADRTDYLENDDYWRSSGEFGGSPGWQGAGPINDVVINEVLAHTDYPQSDTIELYNTTALAINLGGWYLSDSAGDDNYAKFRIPNGTSIPAHGYLTFDESDFNPHGDWHPGGNPAEVDPDHDFALSSYDGDDVWLMKGDGTEVTHFVDHVSFGASVNGESFGRWPNLTGDLYPMKSFTPGAANSGPRVGPVIISELMYHPTDSAGRSDETYEFIEIFNPGRTALDLTDWRIRKEVDFDFEPGATIPAHSAAIIVPFDPATDATALAAFHVKYPGIDAGVPIFGGYGTYNSGTSQWEGLLSNNKGAVQLQDWDEPPAGETDPGRIIEDELNYDDGVTPWQSADGSGSSVYRVDANLWGNDPASWNAALPSPGSVLDFSPWAEDDFYSTPVDTQLIRSVGGVLDNDNDPNGDQLWATQGVAPSHGTLTRFLLDGQFTYQPTAGYHGWDQFTYSITDQLRTDEATVRIAVNTAPDEQDDGYTVGRGGTLVVDAAHSVLVNDSDPDSDLLTARLDPLVEHWPEHGRLTFNTDGTFTYIHDGSLYTTDSFRYRAYDGFQESERAEVTITVTKPSIDVGQHQLLPNTANQTIEIFVTGGVAVEGLNFNIQVANGGPEAEGVPGGPAQGAGIAGPHVTAVDLVTGTIFQDNHLPQTTGGINDTIPQFFDAGIVTATLHGTVPTDGLLATVTLDTTGFFSGTWDLYMKDTLNGPTDFAPIAAEIIDGSIGIQNNPPMAHNDAATVAEGGTVTQLTGGAASVLDNDTDDDLPYDTLTATLLDEPDFAASFTLNPNGTFSYQHDGSENFSDSFTYEVRDGAGETDTARVNITINPVNDNAPVAGNDQATVAEGGTVTLLAGGAASVLDNDTDDDLPGDTLTAVLDDGPGFAANFTLNPNGTFSYEHDGSENFSDSFTYHVHDGVHDSNTATVTITITPVNDHAPVAGDDQLSVAEGGTVAVLSSGAASVLGNDDDDDLPGDTLTAVLDDGPSFAANFTLNANGTFSYEHDDSENFSDSFTYHVNDGVHDSNTATVTITITPVNDNAPVAGDDQLSVTEGGTVTLLDGGASSVLDNDTDDDLPGDTLTAVLDGGPSFAANFTLNPNGTFSYEHDDSENFSDSFTYHVHDGVHDSNTATVTITITPVNDNAPVAGDDQATVVEGGTVTLLDGGASSVLDNDTDDDLPGDTITAVLDSGPGFAPNFTLNADGTFNYEHDGSENFSDSFTYHVNDGVHDGNTATVTITIIPVNDAPVAGDETKQADGLNTVNIDVLWNDYDAEDDPLTIVVLGSTHGTAVVNDGGTPDDPADDTVDFTPSVDFVDSGSFTYKVNDGELDSNVATVTITTGHVNNVPRAKDDSAGTSEDTLVNINVLANDRDFDGDPLTINILTQTNGTAVVNDGGTPGDPADDTVDFTPAADFHGIARFTYLVNDGEFDSNVATVTITVAAVNDAPVADAQIVPTVEDTAVEITLTGSDSDPEVVQTLTFAVEIDPVYGTLSDFNPDTGEVTYTPDADYHGPDSFTFTVTDDAAAGDPADLTSTPATVTINVTAVNDAPVADAQTVPTAEDTAMEITLTGEDGDPEVEQTLTFAVEIEPLHGTLSDFNPDTGEVTYTPDADYHGPDSFTFTVTDDDTAGDPAGLTSTPAMVTIEVAAVNDPPVANAQEVSTDEDLPVAIALSGDDRDPEVEQTLTFAVVSDPVHGTLSDFNADSGAVTYTPYAGYDGPDSFTFTVTDDAAAGDPAGLTSAAATVTITVTAIVVEPLGPIDFLELGDLDPSAGNLWYSLETTRAGLLTLEVLGDGAELTLFDEDHEPLATSTLVGENQRIDWPAEAGLEYLLRVVGNAPGVDLRLANLVQQDADGMTVYGTAGNDAFELRVADESIPGAEISHVVINGVQYQFSTPVVPSPPVFSLVFDGGAGANTVVLRGSPHDETVTLHPGTAAFLGYALAVSVGNAEEITVFGQGGTDVATLYDSDGNDEFVGMPTYAAMSGDGFFNRVRNFGEVHAEATAAGVDVAKFFDSPSDDHYVATPTYAALYNEVYAPSIYTVGFRVDVKHFEGVHAYATAGGRDLARLYDSVLDDVFYGDPIQGALYRPGAYYNRAKHFEGVHAYATAGGSDEARLHGSDDNDKLFADPTQSALYRPGEFYNRGKYFERVYGEAHGGDDDRAFLYDSSGVDLLEAEDNWARLSNAAIDFLYEARAFDYVYAEASTSGDTKVVPPLSELDFLLELDGPWENF